MRSFVTVVFDDTAKAYKGLHALWRLDDSGEITVHGAAVVHRDAWGHFAVDTKETHPTFATAVGVGIGVLLGALAGPVGAVVGAASGAVIGGAVDLGRSDTRAQAVVEARLALARGHSAVIADVSEDWTLAIDRLMQGLGGIVHRRAKSSVEDDATFNDGFYPYDNYLYPYEYVPSRLLA